MKKHHAFKQDLRSTINVEQTTNFLLVDSNNDFDDLARLKTRFENVKRTHTHIKQLGSY
jgi:hypothetical protein